MSETTAETSSSTASTSSTTSTFVDTTPKKTKYRKLAVKIPTSNVNHTALYKYASELSGFNKSGFEANYQSEPSRYKNLESREHDEVISRAIKAMGLKLQFVTGGSKKKGPVRFVEIYGNYSTEDQMNELQKELQMIVKRFQRVPQVVPN
jgi:hypothetical protein